MSRTRMLAFTGLLIGLVLLLALAIWAFFIFQSRTGASVALNDATATAEAVRLTLSPSPGTPSLGATVAPTDTNVPVTPTPFAPAATLTPAAASTTAPSAAAATAGAPSATGTPSPTATGAAPPTGTPTSTPTGIPASTATNTPTVVPSDTPTSTPTNTPTSTPTDTPVPLAVTNVTASVNPASSNNCPTTFNISAQITTNGAGSVIYVWERSNGTTSSNQSVLFGSAGTQAVNDSWTVGTGGSYWERARIVSPNAVTSNQAAFSMICPSNFAGFWYLNFGTMNLSQNGNVVNGTYFNAFEGKSGTIAGSVTGNTFNGNYTIGGSGPLQLTISNNGQTLDGTWSNSPPSFGGGKWCGARSGANFPAGCGFAGSWNASEAGQPSGATVSLTQNGTSISGTFFNGNTNGTFSGATVSYSGGQAVLSGTWHIGSSNGAVKFYLVGYDDVQFQGHYDTNSAWCGWRGGASKPSTCEK